MKTSRMVRIGRAWWLPVLFLLATTVTVKAGTYDDYTYEINSDSTITIIGYTGSGGAVIIPSTIEGKTVTGIMYLAFASCTSLTSVIMPAGLIEIGYMAFASCTSLTSVTLPANVTAIGYLAFVSCTSLMGVYFEGNAPSYCDYTAFAGIHNATVYYLVGTTGWGPTFCGLPTALWNTPPSVPTDVNASDGTYTNKVVVAWSAVSGATSY